MTNLNDKYYNVRIKLRNDEYRNWINKENNFIPYDGEVIIYDILSEADAALLHLYGYQDVKQTPIQLIKIGDGVSLLKDLPFINDFSSYITTGTKTGAINVLGDNVFVKGMGPGEKDFEVNVISDNNSNEGSMNFKYIIKQGDREAGVIEFAKELFVESGRVIEVTSENSQPDGNGGYLNIGTYIELTFNTVNGINNKIYINANSLIEDYKSKNTKDVVLNIDNSEHIIEGEIKENSINFEKLNNNVLDYLNYNRNSSENKSISEKISKAINDKIADVTVDSDINLYIKVASPLAISGSIYDVTENLIKQVDESGEEKTVQANKNFLIFDCN